MRISASICYDLKPMKCEFFTNHHCLLCFHIFLHQWTSFFFLRILSLAARYFFLILELFNSFFAIFDWKYISKSKKIIISKQCNNTTHIVQFWCELQCWRSFSYFDENVEKKITAKTNYFRASIIIVLLFTNTVNS